MRKEVIWWWKQAKRDLLSARNSYRSRDFYVAVFLSEQAAEKALKAAYLLKNNKMPERTHNLLVLGKLLNFPGQKKQFIKELTSDFLSTRYPDAAMGVPADM